MAPCLSLEPCQDALTLGHMHSALSVLGTREHGNGLGEQLLVGGFRDLLNSHVQRQVFDRHNSSRCSLGLLGQQRDTGDRCGDLVQHGVAQFLRHLDQFVGQHLGGLWGGHRCLRQQGLPVVQIILEYFVAVLRRLLRQLQHIPLHLALHSQRLLVARAGLHPLLLVGNRTELVHGRLQVELRGEVGEVGHQGLVGGETGEVGVGVGVWGDRRLLSGTLQHGSTLPLHRRLFLIESGDLPRGPELQCHPAHTRASHGVPGVGSHDQSESNAAEHV
mmetsp:Transcript_19752/g.47992  ORF Transcript_19752/g.47992 Transcript_19752/m.47992 type:complete len:275 (-) Transcript_19752:85-909(-)